MEYPLTYSMRTRRKSRFSRVHTPHQQLVTVNRRAVAVRADVDNTNRDNEGESRQHYHNLDNNNQISQSYYNTPTGVASTRSMESSGSEIPRRLLRNMENNNRPGSSSQVQSEEIVNLQANQTTRSRNNSANQVNMNENVQNGEQSGIIDNGMINARDGLPPFHVDTRQNVGVPEPRTPIEVTRESVMTNLQSEFFRVMTAAKDTWLNSRRDMLDAHNITFFNRWDEEDDENDDIVQNTLHEHQAFVENLRRNKREAIRDQNRSQFFVAQYNTPNEAIDLRQSSFQRPATLDIPRQVSSQPSSYQRPQKRTNMRNGNHITSSASNDGNWRNSNLGHSLEEQPAQNYQANNMRLYPNTNYDPS